MTKATKEKLTLELSFKSTKLMLEVIEALKEVWAAQLISKNESTNIAIIKVNIPQDKKSNLFNVFNNHYIKYKIIPDTMALAI